MGPVTLLEDTESIRGSHYKKSWVVAIGIDYMSTEHPVLLNAKNDAEGFTNLLQDNYGFEEPIKLFDAEAKKDAILALLESLATQVGPEDRLVIFFAGHGTTRVSDAGFKEGYIIPYDGRAGKYYSYIEMEDVRKACDWIPAKHILLILDCCFSGVAAITSRSTFQQGPEAINDAYLTRITQRGARQIMTAGASDELVADSGSRPGHSAFTGALLTGLEGGADHNNDGIITASDLASFIKPLVTRETASVGKKGQTPFFNYLRGSDQGDVVFLRPDTPIVIHPVTPGPIPPPSIHSTFWLVIGGILFITFLGLGWMAFQPGTETPDATAVIQSFINTVTAEAAPQATIQAAIATAAVDKPAPTQTAIAAIQTEEAQIGETAIAATVAILASPMTTPRPPPVSTPTSVATQSAPTSTADPAGYLYECQVTNEIGPVNLRQGPGPSYPIIDQVDPGTHLIINGWANPNGQSSFPWFSVTLDDNRSGWMVSRPYPALEREYVCNFDPTSSAFPFGEVSETATFKAEQTAAARATATLQARQTVAAEATATVVYLELNGPISMAGATTLEGLTDAVLDVYKANGYSGTVQAEYPGTSGGFTDYLCSATKLWDMALATGENRELVFSAQCSSVGRTPLGFQVAWGKVDVGSANERYEPLYLFTTKEILTAKPQIAAFIRYYLTHVNDVLPRLSGFYLPASANTLEQGLKTLDENIR